MCIDKSTDCKSQISESLNKQEFIVPVARLAYAHTQIAEWRRSCNWRPDAETEEAPETYLAQRYVDQPYLVRMPVLASGLH